MLVLCHSKWKISKGSCSPNSFNILLILYSDGFLTKSSAKKQINLKKEIYLPAYCSCQEFHSMWRFRFIWQGLTFNKTSLAVRDTFTGFKSWKNCTEFAINIPSQKLESFARASSRHGSLKCEARKLPYFLSHYITHLWFL